jgi:hypothetical protein
MAVSNGKQRYRFGRRREKGHTRELAGRLAPLEEQMDAAKTHQATPNGKPAMDDTIRVDTAALKLPEKIVEDEREGADIFHLDSVVVYILLVMLAFIAFVAWQITLMPTPAK